MRENGKLVHDGLSRVTTGVKNTSHSKEICNFRREKGRKIEEEEKEPSLRKSACARQNIRVLLVSGRLSRCSVVSSRFRCSIRVFRCFLCFFAVAHRRGM